MSRSPARTCRGSGSPASTADTTIQEARLRVEAGLEAVGIGDLVALVRDAGLHDFDTLRCEGGGATVQVQLERPLPPEELVSLDRVDRWAFVAETSGVWSYVVEFTAPKFPPSIILRRAELLDTCNPALSGDGLEFSVVGPLEAVSNAIDDFERNGLDPDLLRVGPYTGRDEPIDALTERQREVVRTAYDLGYYEVPRTVSSDEVAAELGLEPSTVTEHLQRAERNFLARELSGAR